MRRVWGLPPLRWLLYSAGTAPVLWLLKKPHGEPPGWCEVKRSEGGLANRRPMVAERAPPRATFRSESPAGRTLCRADGHRRGVESSRPRGRVFKATTTTPHNPNPSPQPVMEASEQPKVTVTRKTARPEKPEPKPTAAPKPANGMLLGESSRSF
jgi:hypothetical protein